MRFLKKKERLMKENEDMKRFNEKRIEMMERMKGKEIELKKRYKEGYLVKRKRNRREKIICDQKGVVMVKKDEGRWMIKRDKEMWIKEGVEKQVEIIGDVLMR